MGVMDNFLPEEEQLCARYGGAAQKSKESAQHSQQQRQQSICPQCGGSGVPLLQLRFAEVCPVCKGAGKLLA